MKVLKHVTRASWFLNVGIYVILLFPFIIIYLFMAGFFELFRPREKEEE